MRILLVEDDLGIASFVVKGLKEAGYVVEHVADGPAGLDKLFQTHRNISDKRQRIKFSFFFIFIGLDADDSAVLVAFPHSRDMSDKKRQGEQNGPA